MAFYIKDTSFVVDDDPVRLLDELTNDRLPKGFWTRSEWSAYVVFRMKLINLVKLQKDSERLSLLEE